MITVQSGTFVVPSSPGNQTIDLCFEPKAIMFFAAWSTADSGDFFSNMATSIGFGDADSDFAVGRGEFNGQNGGTFWLGGYPDPIKVVDFDSNCALVSLNPLGFTVNWSSVTNRIGSRVNFIAFGGDTLSAKVDTIFPSGTGPLSFTGVGFQPQCLFLLHARAQDWDPPDLVSAHYDFGCATGPSEQWAMYGVANVNVFGSSTQTASRFEDGKIDVWGQAALSTFDSDGFTINFTGSPGGQEYRYLALADSDEDSFFAGVEAQPGSTGLQTISGIPFPPGSFIATGICNANAGSDQNHDIQTFGAFDAVTSANIWCGSKDGVNPSVTRSRWSDTAVISAAFPAASTTLDAEAVVDSLGSDSIVLDWTTADATARLFGYVAFRSSQSGPCAVPEEIRASFDQIAVQ